MSSIIRRGDIYHGISVAGRGMFTNHGHTYAGQCKDGYACGLGMLTWSNGSKDYAEYGPDGERDGRHLDCNVDGDTGYRLWERGERKDYARVRAGGLCKYNYEDCAPDDPRLLALIAQVAPVEVRPAAPASQPPSARHSDPKQLSDGSAGSFCPPAGAREGHGHRGASPRRTLSLATVRHKPTPAAMQRTVTQ
jgi:hypothetical protein